MYGKNVNGLSESFDGENPLGSRRINRGNVQVHMGKTNDGKDFWVTLPPPVEDWENDERLMCRTPVLAPKYQAMFNDEWDADLSAELTKQCQGCYAAGSCYELGVELTNGMTTPRGVWGGVDLLVQHRESKRKT